jgi:serine phosphatase RsbU (regulator of sigma subunit)
MTKEIQLKQRALELATSIAVGTQHLRLELQELERRKKQIEKELESAALCETRATSYDPRSGIELRCYCCWVRNERSAFLTDIPSGNDLDLYRCSSCGLQLELDP